MIGQLPGHEPVHDRAVMWSWILFGISWPWHLVGGGIAWVITNLAGGDFAAGIGVPDGVYPFLYVWMITPLVASVVVGVNGWVRRHHPAALVPAALSAAIVVMISVFGAEEFFG